MIAQGIILALLFSINIVYFNYLVLEQEDLIQFTYPVVNCNADDMDKWKIHLAAALQKSFVMVELGGLLRIFLHRCCSSSSIVLVFWAAWCHDVEGCFVKPGMFFQFGPLPPLEISSVAGVKPILLNSGWLKVIYYCLGSPELISCPLPCVTEDYFLNFIWPDFCTDFMHLLCPCRYGEALFMNSKLISGVTEFLNTEEELREVIFEWLPDHEAVFILRIKQGRSKNVLAAAKVREAVKDCLFHFLTHRKAVENKI